MFLIYLAAGCAVVLAGICIVIAMLPGKFSIERSVLIDAPADLIFDSINAIQRWETWSPFAQAPGLGIQYTGPFAGVGSSSAWSGGNMGAGRSTIVASVPPERVEIRLDMVKPMRAVNVIHFTLANEQGQTRVTWKMSGENGFLAKAAGVFMNIDAIIGAKFDEGLHQLKCLSEEHVLVARPGVYPS